jgi:signal transduction histidine kinase
MVSAYLREHLGTITADWEQAVRQRVPAIRPLSRPALLDHMPELLDSLASWIDGDRHAAQRGFDALASGHAEQRLGIGVDIETLSIEYSVLRQVLGEHLAGQDPAELVRAHAGLDEAITQSITRYVVARDQIRERFVSVLGHDLRSPLSAIQMAATNLSGIEGLGARERRLVGTVQRSGLRMQRLIEDVIHFARIHLGRGMPAEPTRCDLGEIAQQAVDELHTVHPGRDLRIALAGDLAGTWDRDRVFQAISNLIGNAIQHGDDPVEVTVAEEPGGRAVLLQVANRGGRLPPEELHRLFDPFRAGARSSAGLGLGLYIVQQIAHAHGATCEITAEGDRTIFSIRWPRVPLDDTPDRP